MDTVALLPPRLPGTDAILLETARGEVERFREIRQQQEAEGLDAGPESYRREHFPTDRHPQFYFDDGNLYIKVRQH